MITFVTENGAKYVIDGNTFSRVSDNPLVHRGIEKYVGFQDQEFIDCSPVMIGEPVVICFPGNEDGLVTGKVKEIINS